MGAVSNPLVRGPWALGVDVTSVSAGTDNPGSISPGVASQPAFNPSCQKGLPAA